MGDKALVISTLSATGINTTAAQCNTAMLANTANRARDTLRTSTGECHCTGVGPGSGKDSRMEGNGADSDTAAPVSGSGESAGVGIGGVSMR